MRIFAFCLAGLFFLALGCSQEKVDVKKLIFRGECEVQVKSTPKSAKIMIDGVVLGQGDVGVQIPCGEKRIHVEKSGFRPYFAYQNVTREAPLVVDVVLERSESQPVAALDSQLLTKVFESRLKVAEESVKNRPGAAAAATPGVAVGDQGVLPDDVEFWR